MIEKIKLKHMKFINEMKVKYELSLYQMYWICFGKGLIVGGLLCISFI